MIENPEFVYIHLAKSGGSSIRAILRDCFGFVEDRSKTHVPAYFLRDVIAERRVLGSVRNPLSWYESRLNYPHFRKRPLPFRGSHSLDFIELSSFIQGMADKSFLDENEDLIWRREEFEVKPFKIMKRKRIGFMTFEFLFTYCRDLTLLTNDSAHLEIDFETDLMVRDWILTERIAQSVVGMLQKPEFHALAQARRCAMDEIMNYRVVNSRPANHVKELSAEDADIINALDGPLIAFHKHLSALVSGD